MGEECVTCFEDKTKKIMCVLPCCKNDICLFCLFKLQVTKCPFCRRDLSNLMPHKAVTLVVRTYEEFDRF